ncbi:class I SAM-dependent methyltransferase [Mucilaginibacter sp. AW1-7]|uniref:class I SAM-dependent methyltransferase n=1 Tax=Mucilaginibacter sp. AW1-7 TaxID=3349874 RepID=UPI003F73DE36
MNAERNDIAINQSPIANDAFEAMYVAVRDKEGRLYSDKQVTRLPDVDSGHRYYKEWKMRKHSAGQLIAFLKKQRGPLDILEVGCGNGWLSAKLADIPKAKVTGIDPNRIEIEQANRVFKKRNLKFIHAPFSGTAFNEGIKFDVIIFAASIQYFPSLKEVMNNAFGLLTSTGRVHVLDTHFYHSGEVETAAERSMDYFTSIGFPEMAQCYFHHPLKQVMHLKHKVMFNPTAFFNRIFKKSVFYWIKIKS